MRRDYLSTMKADGFGEFLVACESIKNCKYVLAESKITALLKSIADNKQLYYLFGKVLYDFDYKLAFAESVGNGVFALPTNPKKAIALVFRILVDIDSGKMSLRNFLEAYFYSESINESFARFCLDIIVPFESYCRTVFAHPEVFRDTPDITADDAGYELVESKFKSDLRADALSCISMLSEVASSVLTGIIDRDEFAACLNGLLRALNSESYENVVSSLLGVKFAVAYYFKTVKDVWDIYKKLEYDVKHMTEQ